MKIAVVGSRNLTVCDIGRYLPDLCTEIISGGASGVDTCAAEYARAHGLILTEYLPDYKRFGKGAPIVRNRLIVQSADLVIAFWDGSSQGTRWVINYCKKASKPCRIVHLYPKACQSS